MRRQNAELRLTTAPAVLAEMEPDNSADAAWIK
jgi:hypothetical protein